MAKTRVMFLLSVFAAICCSACATRPALATAESDEPRTQSERTQSEKDARTPAQQKINSQLLYEIYRRRGEAKRKNVPPGPTGVRIDRKDRALVDVRAEVVPALEKKLRALGSTIVSTSREYRSIIAWVPILRIERLAADSTVRAVEPAAEATTNK